MAEEIGKGSGLPVLLPHEEERRERREEGRSRHQLQRLERDLRRQPVARRSGSDLVVVLGEDNQAGGLHAR